MTTRLDVFIDFVCPFCFLFEKTLAEVKRDRDVVVNLRPFELRPHPIPTLRPEDDYLPRIWRNAVYPAAQRVGIPISLPSTSPQPRTERAFMVMQLARENDKLEEFSRAMFSAFFQEDRNIGELDVIVDVATSVGLNAADAASAFWSNERRERQLLDQDYATRAVGVNSVPAMMVAGELVRGVPDAARLKAIIDASSEDISHPGERP